MKKINSNSYAAPVIGCGLLCIAAFFVLREMDALPRIFATACLVLRAAILVGFAIWLCIELLQDKYLNARYLRARRRKLLLASGFFECQICGYQRVGATDRSCGCCGETFEE